MTKLTASAAKTIRSLSEKKFRDKLGLFVVEGEKMVREALNSQFEVVSVYETAEIGQRAMAQISQLSTPSPVLAVVRRRSRSEPEVAPGLSLALDGIRDPGNMGTMLRIADWFGLGAVYASGDSVDFYNPKTIQASMGAIFRVNFHSCSLPRLCQEYRHRGGMTYGCFLVGENMYEKQLFLGNEAPVLLAIGNESEGISDALATELDGRLYIPPYPEDNHGSESLNAAMAAAIALAEFRRRL